MSEYEQTANARVNLTEQELFDRLVVVFEEVEKLLGDAKQLKADNKFHKKTNPTGIPGEDISHVSASAKLEAKQNFEEFTAKNAAVKAKFEQLTQYND